MKNVERICDLLDERYGVQSFEPEGTPLDELVLTILSQNTTGKNMNQAFQSLKAAFPTWDDVRIADESLIEKAIFSGGLAKTRASRIKAILERIFALQGDLDLSWMENASSETVMDYLLQFKGVGPKTAACVLMFSLGRPALPVDTHVRRVSQRLGLLDLKVSDARAHTLLQDIVPDERIYSFHVNMVTHGRKVCIAGRPRCEMCSLGNECAYYRRSLG